MGNGNNANIFSEDIGPLVTQRRPRGFRQCRAPSWLQNKKYFFAGAKSSDHTIEALFAEVDLNGDGKIQPSEFDIDLA